VDDLKWDIFISHASEDRKSVALPLAEALRAAGATVWLDAQELKLGDSLSEKIDDGLSRSRFGAVIVSHAYLSKDWPKKELSGLRAKEENGRPVILPIWHGIERAEVVRFSPTLADALAGDTSKGIPVVANALLDVIFDPTNKSPATTNPPIALRLQRLLESNPSSTTPVVSFLSYHLPRQPQPLGRVIWSPLTIGSAVFDAYTAYTVHGSSLTLYKVSAAWSDPFASVPRASTQPPQLGEPLQQGISEIEEAQRAFLDSAIRHQVAEAIRGVFGDERHNLIAWDTKLRFVLFGGRRSFIDSDASTHSEWGRLRERANVSIKTYDFLLDALREDRNA
jgi:hypothetical protein